MRGIKGESKCCSKGRVFCRPEMLDPSWSPIEKACPMIIPHFHRFTSVSAHEHPSIELTRTYRQRALQLLALRHTDLKSRAALIWPATTPAWSARIRTSMADSALQELQQKLIQHTNKMKQVRSLHVFIAACRKCKERAPTSEVPLISHHI